MRPPEAPASPDRPPVAFDATALLVRIAQAKDRAAFAALFHHYAPRVRRHLTARGIPGGVADEITQEAMLSIWRKAASFDPARGSASPWIFTIARNCLVNHVRRNQRPQTEMDDPARVQPLLADEALMGAETREKLAAALRGLPPEQAAVIHDSYFRGRSLAEVAAEKRLPIGTVKTRARLALARLRTLFSRGEAP